MASGTAGPDALTGAARAAALDTPLLLTQLDHVPAVTWDELERLQPSTVSLTGGTSVISAKVEDLIGGLDLE